MVEVVHGDHARGCDGRNYTCTCGFDDQQEARVAQAYQRGKIEGARLAIEAADRAANKSIAAHCAEIGIGTYFRRGDQLHETSQWWKLQRVEALVREMRDLPGQAIRALSPAKIVGEG